MEVKIRHNNWNILLQKNIVSTYNVLRFSRAEILLFFFLFWFWFFWKFSSFGFANSKPLIGSVTEQWILCLIECNVMGQSSDWFHPGFFQFQHFNMRYSVVRGIKFKSLWHLLASIDEASHYISGRALRTCMPLGNCSHQLMQSAIHV